MTTKQQYTTNKVECKAVLNNNELQVFGTFQFSTSLDPKMNELDALIAAAEAIGQMVKERAAIMSLEESDQRATAAAQRCAQHCAKRLHKNGTRPFTIITPFGRIKVQRQRLRNPVTGKTFIPSSELWETKQNRHIVSALAAECCDTVQEISYRKSQRAISEQSNSESLLAHSTVWNLKQSQGKQLEHIQNQFVHDCLGQYEKQMEEHGLLPLPDSAEELFDEPSDCRIKEEAQRLYHHFTDLSDNERTQGERSDSGLNTKRSCHVPKDVILLQADEVVTKSQMKGCKWNKTFTATIEDGNGRREYLVSRTAFALQILVGAVLLCLGLRKKRLEVISDGASWISTWISRILKVDTYHILCWYHLCKRVYEGLSGVGASKKERRQLELEVLGLLWKGKASEAITQLRSLLPRCRVRARVENLIDYLVRKRSQIADYETRHEQGLWIASTRVERWNDIAVSERCKGRGMSWVDTGVLAIALHASEKKRNQTSETTCLSYQNESINHTSL